MRAVLGWILCFGFWGTAALAAQFGKVIVDSANVLEFPNGGAKPISALKRNSVLQVSNVATEGFYKVRLPSGDIGWVSGNDIFVMQSDPSAGTPRPGPVETKSEEAPKAPIEDSDEFWGDRTRIQLGFGVKDTLYGGLSDHFAGVDQLNYGKTISLEVQRRWFYLLYWGFRIELNTAKTGDQTLSATTVQRINEFTLPLQVGLMVHPIHTRKFRIGLGAYGGVSVVNYTQVEQEVSSISSSVKYSSIDPVGSGVIQVVYGLTKAIGIYGEFDYRYHVTGEQSPTTVLGAIPAFQIDYSSYFFKAGLELRF